jgi:poly(hydroxyalkanoate) granule-associated protein
MARKLKDMVAGEQHAMVDAVVSSAQQIWQAGLGAFARAQQEGGELFDKLVHEGSELQKRTQHLAGEKSLGVAEKVSRLAENVGKQATGSWDKIEKIVEERVARSLRSLGVPSQDEIGVLRREIAELKAAMALAGQQQTAQRTAAASPVATAAAKLRVRAPQKKAPLKTGAQVAQKRHIKGADRHH